MANHSARKTSITNLLNENVSPLHVQQISGHKKLDSLNNYHVASNEQQKNISRILSSCDNKLANKSINNNPAVSSISLAKDGVNNTILAPAIQQQMFENWNPVLPPTFHGAQISNCTFNINISYASSSPVQKRRRLVIIDDDSQ